MKPPTNARGRPAQQALPTSAATSTRAWRAAGATAAQSPALSRLDAPIVVKGRRAALPPHAPLGISTPGSRVLRVTVAAVAPRARPACPALTAAHNAASQFNPSFLPAKHRSDPPQHCKQPKQATRLGRSAAQFLMCGLRAHKQACAFPSTCAIHVLGKGRAPSCSRHVALRPSLRQRFSSSFLIRAP
jgi:hypothetical protein